MTEIAHTLAEDLPADAAARPSYHHCVELNWGRADEDLGLHLTLVPHGGRLVSAVSVVEAGPAPRVPQYGERPGHD